MSDEELELLILHEKWCDANDFFINPRTMIIYLMEKGLLTETSIKNFVRIHQNKE